MFFNEKVLFRLCYVALSLHRALPDVRDGLKAGTKKNTLCHVRAWSWSKQKSQQE